MYSSLLPRVIVILFQTQLGVSSAMQMSNDSWCFAKHWIQGFGEGRDYALLARCLVSFSQVREGGGNGTDPPPFPPLPFLLLRDAQGLRRRVTRRAG